MECCSDGPDYSHEVDLLGAQHEIEEGAERDNLSVEERQTILADNARRFFNL
jgi:predicted TIM-barrel fold metal-dependent hydrolase